MSEPAEVFEGRTHAPPAASTAPAASAWKTSARPVLTLDEAARLARERWGLTGPIVELGSYQDYNARVDAPEGRVVLKVANAAWGLPALQAQHAALPLLARAGVQVPSVVGAIEEVDVGGQSLLAHVLTFVDGTPLHEGRTFGLEECRLLGDASGRVAAALAGFAHPGARRQTQWDLRLATSVIEREAPHLLARVADAVTRLDALSASLPTQTIHGDVTDDNVVSTPSGAAGVIDFGDLGDSWRCAELAVTAASVLAKTSDEVEAVLTVVEAFTAHVHLEDVELAALWPLVVLRAAVLVASGSDASADAGNAYAEDRVDDEQRMLEAALGLDAEEMTWLVRGAGQPLDLPDLSPLVTGVKPLPLDVTSEIWDAGAWLGERAWHDGLPASAPGEVLSTRYGEYRLDHGRPLSRPGSAPTFALGVELDLPVGTRLPPLPRGVSIDGVGADGVVARPWVWLQVCTLPGLPPRTVRPGAQDRWRLICPDPSPLFDAPVSAPAPAPSALLHRRGRHLARVQEHYYERPPQIERGWREFLVDTHGDVYLDMVNNVATTGHGHPTLTRAAARQWSLLNTNSRFHYQVLTDFAERLAALAPDGLDQVFFVNSGSEAVDLALRLVTTATGRPRILAAREAYHGITIGADAVTTSIADNPRAFQTRPDWVELIDTPNPVRGTHRGPGAAAGYLSDLDAQLAGLDGGRVAGVILEPVFGNGGGVLLPDGYLAGVFERVRALGGLCISDEVQVGYGRLGEHFWGFQQQGATPDVITIAKAMGNGQPLGAVVTTAPIASAFAAEGSFFSSAGGSPVSAAVGMAVLDVMEREGLQESARVVGGHLRAGLERLAQRHDAVGAVHGLGLYLGLELVRERETLAPAAELTLAVCDALREEGCIVQPTGALGTVLKLKPPLVISRESVDYFLAALDRVLAAVTTTASR